MSIIFSDIFHVSRLNLCNPLVSYKPHSQPRDPRTQTVTSFRDFNVSKIREHVTARVLSRPHSPVPQILYWSQTERFSWSRNFLSSQGSGHPPYNVPEALLYSETFGLFRAPGQGADSDCDSRTRGAPRSASRRPLVRRGRQAPIWVATWLEALSW